MAAVNDTEGLLVIGAGFMRTGTNSLQLALEQLLGGKCYHMNRVFEDPKSSCKFWVNAIDKTPKQHDWQRFFVNYKATVDFPSVAFYKEIMDAFPNAKVILTVRDPHRWYKSFRETIVESHRKMWSFPMNIFAAFSSIANTMWMMRKVNERFFGDAFNHFDDEAAMVAVFERHAEEVKQHVPPNRLLIFHVKDGWQPLCDFLGLPIPCNAFPHVNTTADYNQIRSGLMKKPLIWLGATLAAIGAIGFTVYYKNWTVKSMDF